MLPATRTAAPTDYARLSNRDLRTTALAFGDSLRDLAERYKAERSEVAHTFLPPAKATANQTLQALSARERECFKKYNQEYRQRFSDEASKLGRELAKRTRKRSEFDFVGYPRVFNELIAREVADDLEAKAKALPSG
jgi:hypothetical protein